MRTRSKRRVGLFSLVILIAVSAFFGIRWATSARPPLPEAVEAMESGDLVAVTDGAWLTFSPIPVTPETGFVFYPGGRIDPRGYAPLMRAIASAGVLVVVPEMPINMAPFRPNVADEILGAYPGIRHWVIGGHSVGGTMAAQYTNSHRDAIAGLAIWASYPADNVDLADAGIPVVLIYGSLDPRVNDDSIARRQRLLPADTRYVRIDGADHHQFGSYEIKPQEHHATIDRAAQQKQTIEQTLNLIRAASQRE
jgi:pimeloyl-ACP methyl ester carboxylesterase